MPLLIQDHYQRSPRHVQTTQTPVRCWLRPTAGKLVLGDGSNDNDILNFGQLVKRSLYRNSLQCGRAVPR
jgi:hypothetical protein